MLLLCCSALRTAQAQPETLDEPAKLRFSGDGTFTILVLSDLQDTQFPSPYLIRSVRSVLQEVPVDLVVLLGDQLEGKSPLFRLGQRDENVKTAIRALLWPLDEAGIPFAVLLGNCDYDAPVSAQRQMALYLENRLCFVPAERETGAYALPVFSSDGKSLALNLYLFAADSKDQNDDFETVSAKQVDWYNKQSQKLHDTYSFLSVPSVAFMHTVVPEVYELFPAVPAGAPGAVAGVGSGSGKHYLLESDQIFAGTALEAPCPSSENNGLFDAFDQNGDVFLAISGHDHLNTFIASLRGIDLASVPGCTYTGYGSNESRGARLFRFTEHSIRDYETLLIPFSDYTPPAGLLSVHYYLTTTTRIPNIVKIGFIFLAVTVLLMIFMIKIIRQDHLPKDSSQPKEDDGFDKPEDAYL